MQQLEDLVALNNKLLAASDFYTGAFSPEYGDVLSGVYDVKLRSGNNEKSETMAGVGIMGTDFTLEGPFKKEPGRKRLERGRFWERPVRHPPPLRVPR